MSNKLTMTVIYFTDGALIDDLHIRRSLLRIPEIMDSLRQNQSEFLNTDLFIAMMDQDVFNKLNFHQKLRLKEVLQNALYQRWLGKGIEPDLVVKRKDYGSFTEVKELFSRLSTIDGLKVVTVGPGFDDLNTYLNRHLRPNENISNDIISQDPKLNWFWNDFKNQIQLHS